MATSDALDRARQRSATVALLIATMFWGCGFTWAKSGGEAVNRLLELPNGSAVGPIWLLAFRFGERVAGCVAIARQPGGCRQDTPRQAEMLP